MDKNGTLTIKDFQAGIADSPLLGFSKMNNVEVFEKQGVAKIQFGTALSFSPASLPVAIVRDNFGNIYVGCEFGQFYVNGVLKNSSQAIYDMKIIIDPVTLVSYLMITRQTDVALWGPINSATASIFSGWHGDGTPSPTFANGYAKPIIIGQDNFVYFGNGNKIASFELSKFHSQPDGIPPTLDVVINPSALTLTQGHYVRCMAELGKYLMIGSQGGSSFYDSENVKVGSIFPWDRTSTTFNLPVIFHENGINQLLQINNMLYINAGTRGRMFISDSTNYRDIKRIPFTYNRQFGATVFEYPNAIQYHNGELLCGISSGSSYDSNSVMGVYSSYLTPISVGKNIIEYPTVMRNSPSNGATGSSSVVKIGAILSTSNDQLYIGWQSGSTYGLDTLGTNLATNFTAIIESPYYNIGTRINQHTFKRMEIALSAPLIIGQQIRISYRTDMKGAYKEIGTYTSTDFGIENSINKMANLAKIIDLQIKIEMTQPNGTAFGNNIELISLMLTSSEK